MDQDLMAHVVDNFDGLETEVEEPGSGERVRRPVILVLAELIHEDYLQALREGGWDGQPTKESQKDWGVLNEATKSSNVRQAQAMPARLRSAGYCIVPAELAGTASVETFDESAVDAMARQEHDGWVAHELQKGNKAHVDIRIWDELDPDTKEKDRRPIRNIPHLLKRVDLAAVALAQVQ